MRLLNSMNTQKTWKKEKLSIKKSFSVITFKLVIKNTMFTIKTKMSSSLY